MIVNPLSKLRGTANFSTSESGIRLSRDLRTNSSQKTFPTENLNRNHCIDKISYRKYYLQIKI